MSLGLVFGVDDVVAQWRWSSYGWNHIPFKYDSCIGITDGQELKGAVFLHGSNGNDVQLSYYGERTLTPRIARTLGQFIINEFDPARVTVIVSKRNKRLVRSCLKFGFKLEGTQHCYYGKQDCNRNTGVRMVMFREMIEQIAQGSAKAKVA